MTFTCHDIINKYYYDYLQTAVVTTEEFDELLFLLDKILTLATGGCTEGLRETLLEILGHKIQDNIRDHDLNTGALSKLKELRSRELSGEQGSAMWLLGRHSYITASVSAMAAGLMGPKSRENLLLEKASNGGFRSFIGGYYTDIGNIFEPVTNNYYSIKNYTIIHDYALIPYNGDKYEFLGASTDGVTKELTNIEIKTLPGRVPDGKVKKLYYHQMQHQMFCLGLKTTDFVEVKYKEHATAQGAQETGKPYGAIAELYDIHGQSYEYEYSPCITGKHASSGGGLDNWIKCRDDIYRDWDDKILARYIYWSLDIYSLIVVKKDPKWIETMGPLLKQFWDEVLELRGNKNKLAAILRDRDKAAYKKKTKGNVLFQKCLL